jgi:hypothetical protein
MLSGFWFLISGILGTVWTIPILVMAFLGFRLHCFKDKEETECIFDYMIKNNWVCSLVMSIEGKERPHGFIIGPWYIAYTTGKDDYGRIQLYIFAATKIIHQIKRESKPQESMTVVTLKDTSDGEKVEEQNIVEIKLFERTGGAYHCLYYMSITIPVSVNPRKNQQLIVDQLIDYHQKHCTTVAFISGGSGTGKTTVGLLVAQATKGMLCKSFNPTDPGDTIVSFYAYAKPTRKNPLIMVLDEVDIMLEKIHQGINSHKDIPILVKDKMGWSALFDDIHWRYPFMIIIMTSNKTKQQIDEMDVSYLRRGRVDLYLEM